MGFYLNNQFQNTDIYLIECVMKTAALFFAEPKIQTEVSWSYDLNIYNYKKKNYILEMIMQKETIEIRYRQQFCQTSQYNDRNYLY